MLISELAWRTNSSARALRHYDRHDLLGSSRLANGYRDFPESAVAQVGRIRWLLGLGLALAEAAELLRCFTDDGTLAGCPAARRRLTGRLARLDATIAELLRQQARVSEQLAQLDT